MSTTFGPLAEGNHTRGPGQQLARSAGLEPATYGLEGRCSIQLCYERLVPPAGLEPARLWATDFKSVMSTSSIMEAESVKIMTGPPPSGLVGGDLTPPARGVPGC